MRNCTESTRKHLCRNLFFDKVKLWSAASLKTSLKNSILAEHCRAIASDYSRINSSEGRMGKPNCKLWHKNWSICTNLRQKCKLSKNGSPGEIWTDFGSSHSQIFLFLKCRKFHRKTPVLEALNKVAILKTLLQREFNAGVFLQNLQNI